MKPFALLTVLITIISLTSCGFSGQDIDGNGQLQTENRPATQTEKIRLDGSFDVIVVSGAPGVRVEADENLLPYIETKVDDGWLVISTKDGYDLNSKNSIKVYVTTQNLSDLSLLGSGNITCNNQFTSNNKASFEVSGSGNLFAKINAPSVHAELNGSGNLEVTGEAKDVDVEINGSGNFKGQELKAENAKIEISGSGDAYAFADDNLKAEINGSGTVNYTGKANVKSDITGSGSVVKIQ